MLELYQFELSAYCEKVRLILDYKGLAYKKRDVVPGVGQLELFRLSGQRQVPVLKDGDTYIADSTEIAFYLDRKYPEKPIIPIDPLQRGQCLLIEEWADESLGLKGRTAFLGAFAQNQNFRTAFLPRETPDFMRLLLGSLPGELIDIFGTGVGLGKDAINTAKKGLQQDLEALNLILANRPYLVGDQPSLADLAVAGLSVLLKFPQGSYLNLPPELQGKGIPGLADNSAYEGFFVWRDRLYSQYRQTITPGSSTPPIDSPNSIQIE
ncbi:Gst1 protein [Microcystis aeruginosa PCC 9432]|jgi:glutathione S-transferase|uniref:Gst1 protein n=1 Tax=Microcystis aeruginosa PCC 9432 TaxID=1160280 RepID=A0A830ZYI7_MICAE|nr:MULTISPECIES: glutathione S-transferase family protein [Microcystis]TRT93375.1 MAG: glutathione S-transferase family protein [Microcystis aeruginosa Ma_OC_LR_19540900_S633]MBE9246133.1 glutathione S-transferase family protein [Microcystis aeruginosa LEGE 00239]MCZ8242443.1 glutathione S-transferase family protein [Microcystis sp. LE19-131.1A]TYT71145.1 glutathione S-transferase family protein [Microcystis aeruginosa KLA2]CCH94989.1 Gst1 protein [Microcystis aeruginosa PCC 9432]